MLQCIEVRYGEEEVRSDLGGLAADRPVPAREISARRYERYAGQMASLFPVRVPWWTWLLAASFLACFVVGSFYLPFEIPEATGIGFALGGARVVNVAPGTPAEQAGFKSGDEIIEMDGRAVHNAFEAGSVLSNTIFDRPVSVVALRDGKEVHLQLILQRRGAKYDSIGPLCVGWRWGSVLGEHPLAPLLPACNVGHHRRRNDIGHAAEPDFGSGLTGSFTTALASASMEPSRE